MTPVDLVVVPLIANAVQNAMVGRDTSARPAGFRDVALRQVPARDPGPATIAGEIGSSINVRRRGRKNLAPQKAE